MRALVVLLAGSLILASCDENRLYETNYDFENRYWVLDEEPSFEFQIDDTTIPYNLYVNIRNELAYPKSNLYFTYYLTDSTGTLLEKQLMSEMLFDKKSGEPFGNSVLGDIYDHQQLLLKDYTFQHPGQYRMRYKHFMRQDTVSGLLAIGLRVEKP